MTGHWGVQVPSGACEMSGSVGPGQRQGGNRVSGQEGIRVSGLQAGRRLRGMVTVAAVAFVALAGTAVMVAAPAGASTAPLIKGGTAGYQPGTTSPPNQFNVLTLVTGGASAVNTSSLTVVTQPASGTATVSYHGHLGHHHLHAGGGHHRGADPDLRLLRPGRQLSERRQLHDGHHDLPAGDRTVAR